MRVCLNDTRETYYSTLTALPYNLNNTYSFIFLLIIYTLSREIELNWIKLVQTQIWECS